MCPHCCSFLLYIVLIIEGEVVSLLDDMIYDVIPFVGGSHMSLLFDIFLQA